MAVLLVPLMLLLGGLGLSVVSAYFLGGGDRNE